eukprot:7267274-Prymnesium_polylepis.1
MMNPIGLRTDVSLDPPPPPTGAISERVGREKKEKKLHRCIFKAPHYTFARICAVTIRYSDTMRPLWMCGIETAPLGVPWLKTRGTCTQTFTYDITFCEVFVRLPLDLSP